MKSPIFLLTMILLVSLGCQTNSQKQETTETQEEIKFQNTENVEKQEDNKNKSKRIFILHSYHEEMEWVQEINTGISTALRKRIGVDLETQYFYMDTKRHTDEEWKQDMAKKAMEKIKEYDPKVVICSDDNATNYVAGKMTDSKYQFVFLGVNANPTEYGFPAANVTGFLEHENFVQTANLVKEIAPRIEKVVFLADKSPSTAGLEQRVMRDQDHIPMEVVAVRRIPDFKTWQEAVRKYQNESDCLILGHYHTIKDEEGNTIPAPKIMEWTLKNSNIPEGSFWAFSVNQGVLCAITVSGYQHGLQAAKRALEVIDLNKKAGEFAIETIHQGEQMVNTKRAEALGITIAPVILNNSKIVEKQTALEK